MPYALLLLDETSALLYPIATSKDRVQRQQGPDESRE